MAVIDFFDRGWRGNPDGIAYVQDDRTYTFQEAGELSCRVANALLADGLPSGTKGAVWAGNDVTAWVCTLGLWRANMTWLPVNARNSPEENLRILDAFDCEVVFFQAAFAPLLGDLRERLPKVLRWVCLDGEVPGAVTLDAWLDGQSTADPALVVDLDDVVSISPTGGTTGPPKGVMNTHRSMQTFIAHFLMAFPYGPEERPVNLAAAPMTHTAGALSLPTTARGGTVVVVTSPQPDVLLDQLVKQQVTELFLPPTVIYRLLEAPGIELVDVSSLKYFLYGAAPMSVEKLKKAVEVFGPVMAGGYGQTEAPASIAFLPPAEHFRGDVLATDERLSSVGRPSPLVRVEILDDDHRVLGPGETGEICVRGDLVMKGYYNAPEQTAETIVDGWLHTGDVGHLDTEGYLHITDRKKDMIITGGFNVYPSEVEQVIWSHPKVQDCAVIGTPDEQWGEAVKAVVELNPGETLDGNELIALCKARLGSVKAPKSIDFVDALPRSAVGKVLKKDLRATYWARAERAI
ncbi:MULTISPECIES: AMP-binding protein [unclassified Nocardioides]|uniref:AMP-binding protein n=1 Tax=unclassified Nocardioides TaxID=2615069 RepID=UPI00070244D1|nr:MULTISPECIES: AMP-binding protein [unclassified Nocardioides]KRC53326.1 long-chain fatty acid--CoA ligase [Nocardioides sp. Root79]KRC70663.1 long-chain fatty acid--CoA ligase [Nocardioides sp. Root240]